MNFPGIMPKYYMEWMDKKLFCISASYMTEIKRNAMRAFEEWVVINRPFDTMIREMCLLPAIAHVAVAFKLIEDCAYNPSTKYFDRGDLNKILRYAMMFRFWSHQTGMGLIEDHSEFKILESFTKKDCHHISEPIKKQIKKFLKAIEQFKKNMEKEMNIGRVPIEEEDLKIKGKIND